MTWKHWHTLEVSNVYTGNGKFRNKDTKVPPQLTNTPLYFLGLTAHPATIRALPPVGVQSRALQLKVNHQSKRVLIAHNNRLGMTEHSGTINYSNVSNPYMLKQPGHRTSIK